MRGWRVFCLEVGGVDEAATEIKILSLHLGLVEYVLPVLLLTLVSLSHLPRKTVVRLCHLIYSVELQLRREGMTLSEHAKVYFLRHRIGFSLWKFLARHAHPLTQPLADPHVLVVNGLSQALNFGCDRLSENLLTISLEQALPELYAFLFALN